MKVKHKRVRKTCPAPVSVESAKSKAEQQFAKLLDCCQSSEATFAEFEKTLVALMATLGCLLIELFLAARHRRLDVQPYLEDGAYRLGKVNARRTLKTAYGEVAYVRTQLIRREQGSGFYPLDAVLGVTRDRLSPWVMQLVGRLATRMSFAATRLVCKAVLRWSPATETIEQVVLGLGRRAAPFMQQLAAPENDGEVLVIEVDGKCPPMATEAELAKRRGKRKPKKGCGCGRGRGRCQRHRGRQKRQARGSKKRRKKGDKSKNGKEAVMVVMYTLKQGADGKLHGPVNKKTWGSLAGRKAAATWARAEATKRGFGPDTTKIVQIVMDGVKSLYNNLKELFPKAIFTLDVYHVVERLWQVGRCFHAEGTEELQSFVAELKQLLYDGRAAQLVKRLRELLAQVAPHGPGTKARRTVLAEQIGYLEPRLAMMRYQEWRKQDLVIGSGQVEGAVRQVVGERMDCAGMRWVRGKAELLLHLRCIELNGDWDHFITWVQRAIDQQLRERQRVKILTDQPIKLKKAA